jgi:hypothetical protein
VALTAGPAMPAPMRVPVCILALALLGCERQPPPALSPEDEAEAALGDEATAEERAEARLDARYPRYGAITGIQLRIHVSPSEEAAVVGWVRTGASVRLGAASQRGPGCRAFVEVHPRGWLCVDEGVEVRDAPVEIVHPTEYGWHEGQPEEVAEAGGVLLPPTAQDAPLPYAYYYVREDAVPEYHRLPSRGEQRRAMAKARRYLELRERDEARAGRYLRGESDDGPPGTVVVHEYRPRRFYVASNGVELRARRRFVRTPQGRYLKQAQLEARNGHDFTGVELGEGRSLPVAWTVRAARPFEEVTDDDGSTRLVRMEGDDVVFPRQTLLEGWQERRNMDGQVMHVVETDAGTRYLRSWFAVVAERVDRPEGVAEDEPWVHVDLSEQTLVLYEGDAPVYATLVSTGQEGHETPTGLFEIRRKHVTDTMANLGPDAGDDAYRIEDVPWTQYFEGSIALHVAFWHTRFGIPRSHGCVNLTPADGHRIFGATWPAVPDGWHGAATEGTELRGSHVLVTE